MLPRSIWEESSGDAQTTANILTQTAISLVHSSLENLSSCVCISAYLCMYATLKHSKGWGGINQEDEQIQTTVYRKDKQEKVEKISTALFFLDMDMCYAQSVISNSLRPHVLQPTRLLCPWGFFSQDYWSGLLCPPPGDLPDPGIKPQSPALQADSVLSEPPGSPNGEGRNCLTSQQPNLLPVSKCLTLKQLLSDLGADTQVTHLGGAS